MVLGIHPVQIMIFLHRGLTYHFLIFLDILGLLFRPVLGKGWHRRGYWLHLLQSLDRFNNLDPMKPYLDIQIIFEILICDEVEHRSVQSQI